MGYFLPRMRRVFKPFARCVVSALAASVGLGFASAEARTQAGEACRATVYLTFDTGHMEPAEAMRDILRKHGVKATFFIANEKTKRGDQSLAASWAPYWRSLVADGHAFGSHTWRHWYFRGDPSATTVNYVAWSGQSREVLDAEAFCRELRAPEVAFKAMTGNSLSPIWRAPGGKLTPNAVRFAKQCGFEHVGWSDAGFSGDELPSDQYPSDRLIARQLRDIKDGDILLWHLGIWSRKDALWPRLDDLITGLKQRGFCFARITDRPASLTSLKELATKP
jgi:peptidoglycan/xylan/chitin deacetylase (PgdA/CDA1 family)